MTSVMGWDCSSCEHTQDFTVARPQISSSSLQQELQHRARIQGPPYAVEGSLLTEQEEAQDLHGQQSGP